MIAPELELRDLELFWRGRAKALRELHKMQALSDATLARAETYEKCADEIEAALSWEADNARD